MANISSYKDLRIWIQGIEIVELIYDTTKDFPKAEQFGLTSQIRRCSVSVPSNIAEGWGRGYQKSLIAFLRIARASLYELETQIIISERLKYVEKERYEKLMEMILVESRMINAFMTTVKNKINK